MIGATVKFQNLEKSFNPPTSNVIKWVSLFNTLFERCQFTLLNPKKFFLSFFFLSNSSYSNLLFLSPFISIYLLLFYLDQSFFLVHMQTTEDYFYAFFFDVWRKERIGYCCAMYMYWVFSCHRHFDRGWTNKKSKKNHPRPTNT